MNERLISHGNKNAYCVSGKFVDDQTEFIGGAGVHPALPLALFVSTEPVCF